MIVYSNEENNDYDKSNKKDNISKSVLIKIQNTKDTNSEESLKTLKKK